MVSLSFACTYMYAPIVSTVEKHNLFIYCPPTILFMNIEYFLERRVLARCWLKPISCCEVEIWTTHQQTDNISSFFFFAVAVAALVIVRSSFVFIIFAVKIHSTAALMLGSGYHYRIKAMISSTER